MTMTTIALFTPAYAEELKASIERGEQRLADCENRKLTGYLQELHDAWSGEAVVDFDYLARIIRYEVEVAWNQPKPLRAMNERRPRFTLTIEARPDASDPEGHRRLWLALKVLLRRFGWRCIGICTTPKTNKKTTTT
jgi:hypothetical protein